MSRDPHFDKGLAGAFHLEPLKSFSARYLQTSEVVVTEIHCTHANNGWTDPLPIGDAFLVTTQLMPCQDYSVTVDDRPISNAPLSNGTTSVFDLRTSIRVENISPFRNLHFRLPKSTMQTIASDNGLAPIETLNHDPGVALDDRVIAGLSMSLLPAFNDPDGANILLVDHVTLALAAYVASKFGTRLRSVDRREFSLSSDEERRAKEMLNEARSGNIRLGDLAAELNLSVRELCDGFRRATGQTPHRWLKARRLEVALDLLRTTALSTEEIASRAGFHSRQQMERELRASKVIGLACPDRVAWLRS